MRFLARLAAAFVLLLLAAIGAGAATLSAEDRQDVARVEFYLNDIKTLQSRFLQIATDGSSVESNSMTRAGSRLTKTTTARRCSRATRTAVNSCGPIT